ncbi:MAG: glycosyltransferase [Phycisphaerales bacterium]|nr:glycosyltransferase [Phycisphaerales bacterium]
MTLTTLSFIALLSFVLVVIIQFFYYGCFFLKIPIHHNQQVQNNNQQEITINDDEGISIVITVKYEYDKILNVLPNLLNQKCDSFEVVLVNDNSNDDIKYLLQSYLQQYPNLKHIEIKQEAKLIKGKKYPLTVGIRSATNDIIVFAKSDTTPHSEQWVNHILQSYKRDPNIEIVIGYNSILKTDDFFNLWQRFENFHSALQYLSFAMSNKTYRSDPSNTSYRKRLFMRHRGFSSIYNLRDGEYDYFIHKISNKKNTKVLITQEAITYTSGFSNFKSWYKQKIKNASALKFIDKRTSLHLALYALSEICFYPSLIIALCFNHLNQLFSYAIEPSQVIILLFIIRVSVQHIVFYKSLKILQEKDLFKSIFYMDILLSLHYFKLLCSLLVRKRQHSIS